MKRLMFVVAALAAALAFTPTAEAQGRRLTGRVTNNLRSVGIPQATVSIVGSATSVQTDADGDFLIANAPAGAIRVQARAIGFSRRTVDVDADQAEVQIGLDPDVLRLQEVVVTGQATGIERRNLPNAVATVSAAELSNVPTASVEQQLQGKVAGASIQTNSGAPGGGVQVRLRGVTSINAAAEPLYVIDGVVVSDVAIPSNQNAVTNAAGGSNPSLDQDAQVNRIADLNPNDIESVEILKGASASAIYGQRASNGVVIITTKRGQEGAPRFSLTQRFGVFSLSNKLGTRVFETQEEAVAAFGPSVAAQWQAGRIFDHEEQLADNGDLSYETLGSLSGGDANTRYYASGSLKNDEGVITNTGFQRQSLRLNLDQQFGDRFSANVSTNILHTLAARGLTNNDNTSTSFYMAFPATPNFVDLTQDENGLFRTNPGAASNPLQTAALMRNDEDVWRLIGAGSASVDLIRGAGSSLRVIGTGGVDFFQQQNDLLFPPELQFEDDDGEPGTALLSNSRSFNGSLTGNVVHQLLPTGRGFGLTTSLGVQYAARSLNINRIVSRNLAGGPGNVDNGTNVTVLQPRQRIKDLGFYGQGELLTMGERLLFTAGLRGDRSSLNARTKRYFLYPKAATSLRFPGFAGEGGEFKLRAAYGESGNQPLYGQKFTALAPTQNIEGLPTLVTQGNIGAPDLRPERQREIEAGTDLSLPEGRASLEFTVYQKSISDLLLQRALAPSTGFALEIFNTGKLRTRGVEVGLGLVPANGPLSWTSRTTFALTRSKITELPVPAFITAGFGTALGAFRIEEGASPTQIVGNDTLPDGRDTVRALGDATPDFTMSFTNDFTYKSLGLHFLLDWQQGAEILNLTKLLYDFGSNTADFDEPIEGSTETVGQRRLAGFGRVASNYIESASFLKLREITLSYDLPAGATAWLFGGVRSARLSLSGRNLFTITPYSGLDPEVSNFGNQAVGRNIDVAPYPPSRSFWLSVDVGF